MNDTKQKSDQRTGEDRRSWQKQLDFPYLDSHGNLILDDRRNNMERRTASSAQGVSTQVQDRNHSVAN